jgi:hypothetical protein
MGASQRWQSAARFSSMNTRPVFRLAAIAGIASISLLAGCMTPATSVRYGEVAGASGSHLPQSQIYSGGTGVFSGGSPGGGYYDEPAVVYDEAPTVIYGDPAVSVRPPLVVQPPVYVAPAPVYVDPGAQWYPWYPGYSYGGSYYRGHRVAPPPRHVHPPRHRVERPGWDGGNRGPGWRGDRDGPSSGIRQSPRPPAVGGGAPQRPGARPGAVPRPDSGIRAMPPAPPARGYGRRSSGEDSGP